VPIGARQATPGIPVAPAATGPVAAAEAGDLAVGAQSVSGGARFTVLNADGSSPRAAVLVVDGRVARPCPGTGSICYQASVGSGQALSVTVLRAGVAPVTATLELPPAGAAPAAGLVAESARALRALDSVRIENDLASDPIHSVHTTFVAQSPDRLSIDVRGGARSRIIGRRRWDFSNGSWVEQPISPSAEPDPFWAPGAMAAYVSRRSGTTIEVTEVLARGPTFFRLLIDRRTHLVTELHMVTAAHFMQERYLDVNRAGPVLPPAAGSP
jgi:hypothetical protein